MNGTMNGPMKGILLSKIPQSDYNFLGSLLIANGKTIFLQFPASRGSGKRKSQNLEVGNCLELEISKGKNNFYVKEWHSYWYHRTIRTSYPLYVMLCVYLEVINNLALPSFEGDDSQDQGLFILLSNAIFYLDTILVSEFHNDNDKSNNKQNFTRRLNFHLAVFLTKLIRELGIFPSARNCVLCDAEINFHQQITIRPDLGGIQCASCGNSHGEEKKDLNKLYPPSSTELNLLLNKIHKVKYKALFGESKTTDTNEAVGREVLDVLFNYFCYQLQLNRKSFKTLTKYLSMQH